MNQSYEPEIDQSTHDSGTDRLAESGIGLLSIMLPAAAGALAGRFAGGSQTTAVFGALFAGIAGLVLYLIFAEN
jgi:hypothetical protein